MLPFICILLDGLLRILRGHPYVFVIGMQGLGVGMTHSGSGLIARVGGLHVGIQCPHAFVGVVHADKKSLALFIGVDQGGWELMVVVTPAIDW